MRISSDTIGLRPYFGDKGAIRILAEAGFDCVDYTMDHMHDDDSPLNAPDYQEYAKELREYGESLGITFNQGHAPFEFDWDQKDVMDNVVIPKIARSLEVASIMGIPTVIVHPLHFRSYFHNSELVWEENMAFFQKLLPYAHKYGVRIALENLFQFDARGVALPDTCADPARYVKALDALNDSHIVACVDVGHACLIGEDPAVLIRALGHNRLKALHIHDNLAVVDDHVLPYLGKIDWDGVAKALADIDYDGDFTFESFLFLRKFEKEFMPTAARWTHEMGEYLCRKIEQYKQ